MMSKRSKGRRELNGDLYLTDLIIGEVNLIIGEVNIS